MKCPKCKSENVTVQIMQTAAKTKEKKTGCLWGLGRIFLIFCTGGLWLIIGKRRGTAKTKFENETVAVCQQCGNRWKV